jgi:hypothetical protein
MFLSYQHEVRNVIFHQDIPEFIIISVEWFFGLINVLIATFYENSSFECKRLDLEDLLSHHPLRIFLLTTDTCILDVFSSLLFSDIIHNSRHHLSVSEISKIK